MGINFTVHADVRGLVVETDNPAPLLLNVPTAFTLDETHVGMPHDINSCIRLAAMGLQPPNPIQSYYHFPRDTTLVPDPFEHQPITAGFLLNNPRSYCLNGIGTGKTLTAAWSADYLMTTGDAHRAIVVAPLSSLERAWADTLFYHFRHRKYVVLHGSRERRLKLLAQPADFYIVNHDGLAVLQAELAARDDIDIWIIDELAEYRNAETEKWAVLNTLLYPRSRAPRPWVWGLTGAPRPEAPTDVYGQCKLVTPTRVPKFFTTFRNLTMTHEGPYVWIERPEANNIVFDAMRPSIRYRREDCLDLPGELFSTRDVVLSAEQTHHYKEIQKELFTEIAGGRIRAINEVTKRSKLLQISCGVVYDVDGTPRTLDARKRIEELLSTIEQCDEKVIVYVPFTEVTNMLYAEVAKHWSGAIVHGGIAKNARDKIFADFQSLPDPSVLIAHPGCMAHALTLTEASTIIWYAPIDSFKTYEQANGRITRAGQKYVANIINLAGSAIERRMYKRLERKQSTQGCLLEMLEKRENLI